MALGFLTATLEAGSQGKSVFTLLRENDIHSGIDFPDKL